MGQVNLLNKEEIHSSKDSAGLTETEYIFAWKNWLGGKEATKICHRSHAYKLAETLEHIC